MVAGFSAEAAGCDSDSKILMQLSAFVDGGMEFPRLPATRNPCPSCTRGGSVHHLLVFAQA